MTSAPPPLLKDQRVTDREHLNLLSIFHFVCAGLAILGLMALFLHYSLFNTFFLHAPDPENARHAPHNLPPPEILGYIKWFYVIFAIWFAGSGVLNAISGFFIRARKNRTFSLVVAGVNCLHVPLGTVLGVFTFIVLTRDSVREVYES